MNLPSVSPAPLETMLPQRQRVLREMVCRRTRELASQDGRDWNEIRRADYERAKLEVTGETDPARQLEILGSNPD